MSDRMDSCVEKYEGYAENPAEKYEQELQESSFGRTSQVFIRTEALKGSTELADVYFTAPFKVMRPFAGENGWKQIMIMSVSAGTMAGDRQRYRLEIGRGSRVEITSQAYEKIHRMKEGFAERETEITVEQDAILYYRPQPVIPFAGSDFRSRTVIHLRGKDARLIMSDILCSGRAAMGEHFAYRYYGNLVEIYKGTGENQKADEGESEDKKTLTEKKREYLYYRDNTKYSPCENKMDMTGFGMYEGYGYLLNLLFSNIPVDKEEMEKIRSIIEKAESEQITGGCSRTWDGDLVIRALGMSAEKLENLSERIVKEVMENM